MVKYRDLNPHPTRDLNPPPVVLERCCQWIKHQKQRGTFANSNTQGNTTTKRHTFISNKNNNLKLQFRLPQLHQIMFRVGTRKTRNPHSIRLCGFFVVRDSPRKSPRASSKSNMCGNKVLVTPFWVLLLEGVTP